VCYIREDTAIPYQPLLLLLRLLLLRLLLLRLLLLQGPPCVLHQGRHSYPLLTLLLPLLLLLL
jgi:hypothetical protein